MLADKYFSVVYEEDISVGQPAWQESSKVKSQSRDFRFIFDEKWRSTLRLKYVGLQQIVMLEIN